MKVCTKCGESKSASDFPKRSRNKDGLSSWCKTCFREHSAAKYKSDPLERERKSRNRVNLSLRNKEKMAELLSRSSCLDCGTEDPRVLEFDHRIPGEKSFSIAESYHAFGWETISQEIAKCDIVCSNCHRIRTSANGEWWRTKQPDLRKRYAV